jgi:hypothetical protein
MGNIERVFTKLTLLMIKDWDGFQRAMRRGFSDENLRVDQGGLG